MEYTLSTFRRRILLLLYGSTAFLTAGGALYFLSGRVVDPLHGVAYTFWFAFGLLALFGIWHPLKMLPLLLLQLIYKSTWILSIGMPMLIQGHLQGYSKQLFYSNLVYVIFDVVAIPWKHVFRTYFSTKTLEKNPV